MAFAELHRPEALDQLLPRADFVILTVPHTPATEGFFDRARFQRMEPTAFFINIGRGMTTKLDDLVTVLEAGEIAGAALDRKALALSGKTSARRAHHDSNCAGRNVGFGNTTEVAGAFQDHGRGGPRDKVADDGARKRTALRRSGAGNQITLLPFTPFTNDALGRTNRTKQVSLSSAAAKSKAGPS